MKNLGTATFMEVKMCIESLHKTSPKYRSFYDYEIGDLVKGLFKRILKSMVITKLI